MNTQDLVKKLQGTKEETMVSIFAKCDGHKKLSAKSKKAGIEIFHEFKGTYKLGKDYNEDERVKNYKETHEVGEWKCEGKYETIIKNKLIQHKDTKEMYVSCYLDDETSQDYSQWYIKENGVERKATKDEIVALCIPSAFNKSKMEEEIGKVKILLKANSILDLTEIK